MTHELNVLHVYHESTRALTLRISVSRASDCRGELVDGITTKGSQWDEQGTVRSLVRATLTTLWCNYFEASSAPTPYITMKPKP